MVPIEQSNNVINTTLLGFICLPQKQNLSSIRKFYLPMQHRPLSKNLKCHVGAQINAMKKDMSVVLFDNAGQISFNMFVKSWLNFIKEFLVFYFEGLLIRVMFAYEM